MPKGDRLATIVHAPGEEDGLDRCLAPQAGFILTRVSRRSTRAGDDLIKLVGESPSATCQAKARWRIRSAVAEISALAPGAPQFAAMENRHEQAFEQEPLVVGLLTAA